MLLLRFGTPSVKSAGDARHSESSPQVIGTEMPEAVLPIGNASGPPAEKAILHTGSYGLARFGRCAVVYLVNSIHQNPSHLPEVLVISVRLNRHELKLAAEQPRLQSKDVQILLSYCRKVGS
jgi:hypothetical protein